MKNKLFLYLSFLLLAVSLYLYFTEPKRSFDSICTLDRVVDGDTAWVRCVYGFKEGQRIKVRLADIDAPERGDPGYGAAKNELNRLLASAPCVVLDVDSPPYDRYGRVVAVVYIPQDDDLLNVNTYLVSLGLAEYVDYEGSFHPEDFTLYVSPSSELESLLNAYCR